LIFGSPTTPIISLINQIIKEKEQRGGIPEKENKRKSKMQIERDCDFNPIAI
jgi:hypothetical protein